MRGKRNTRKTTKIGVIRGKREEVRQLWMQTETHATALAR